MTTPQALRQRGAPQRQLSVETERPSPLLHSPITLQYSSTVSSPRAASKYIPISNFSYPSPSSQPSVYQDSSVNSKQLDGNGWKQRVYLFISLLVLAAPWLRHSHLQWNINKLRDELNHLQNDQMRLQARMRTQKDALQKIKKDSDRQQETNDRLLAQLRAHGDSYEDFDSEQYARTELMENAYFQRIEELEAEIQRSADRLLAARGYGTPFHRAEAIRVEILLKQPVSKYGNRLVMELGPLNSLSHAIELFLMLVEHKHFYDNLTLMHRSAGSSVISTVPMDSETLQIVSSDFVHNDHAVLGSSEAHASSDEILTKEDHFMMDQLAMLEHTEDFPIQKYSVLFVDKGPHFYINMDSRPNPKTVLTETCFGLIVEGLAILEFMSSHHDKNFKGLSMVGIESVRVIKPNDDGGRVGIDPRFAQPLTVS
jgi:hypothetical protein